MGIARRIGENALSQRLSSAEQQIEVMHIALVALITYFGGLPGDLDTQLHTLLAAPDIRKKPRNEVINAVVSLVTAYKQEREVL